MDVVLGVADSDPAAAVRVAVGCQADGLDEAAGDGVPFGVAQDAVAGVGAHRAVPHVLGWCAGAGLRDAQVQGCGQAGEGGLRVGVGAGVAARVGSEAVPGADEVGVGVLVALAGAEEVDEHAVGARAAPDLGDHQSRPRARVSAVSSTRARIRVSTPSAWSSSPGRDWPPEL